jgi:hypothetical protein
MMLLMECVPGGTLHTIDNSLTACAGFDPICEALSDDSCLSAY